MASKIDSETRRLKLPVRREPHWEKVQVGGYVGFRRTVDGGTWVARWRDEQGKQHYRALDISRDAPDPYVAARKAAEQFFHQAVRATPKRITVAQACERYIRDRQIAKGEAAARDAGGRIRRCILEPLGAKPLDALRSATLKDWLHGLLPAEGDEDTMRRAKDSANRNLSCLKAILNLAFRDGLVVSDDAWRRVPAFASVGEARKVFLNAKQRARLVEACSGGFRDLVEAALLTGARYGELAALKAGDFDRRRGVLNIRKGKTGPRSVPLSGAAAALFTRLAANKLPEAWLLTRDDGQPWKHSDQDELMKAAVVVAKLPKAATFYALRHTHIAAALEGGMGVHEVARLCGTSVRMIEKHYGKLLHGNAQERLDRIAFL